MTEPQNNSETTPITPLAAHHKVAELDILRAEASQARLEAIRIADSAKKYTIRGLAKELDCSEWVAQRLLHKARGRD